LKYQCTFSGESHFLFLIFRFSQDKPFPSSLILFGVQIDLTFLLQIAQQIFFFSRSPREFPGGKSKKKKVWASIKPLQQLLKQFFFFFKTMDTKRTLPPPTKNERTGLIEWNLSCKEFSFIK